jgi:hypothetical protein
MVRRTGFVLIRSRIQDEARMPSFRHLLENGCTDSVDSDQGLAALESDPKIHQRSEKLATQQRTHYQR